MVVAAAGLIVVPVFDSNFIVSVSTTQKITHFDESIFFKSITSVHNQDV